MNSPDFPERSGTYRILLVSNQEFDYVTVCKFLLDTGREHGLLHRVVRVVSVQAVLSELLDGGYDAVFLDSTFGDGGALGCLKVIRFTAPETLIIILGGEHGDKAEEELLLAGAEDWLVRGKFSAKDLALSLRRAIIRHQAKCRLEGELEEERSLNETKGELLKSLNQELSAPLAAVVGLTEMLIDSEERSSNPSNQALLTNILSRSKQVLRLVKTIADYSSLRCGDLPVIKVRFELLPFLGDIEEKMNSKAAEKKRTLSFRYLSDLPEIAETDPDRLKQVLLYVIGTAIELAQKEAIECGVTFSPNTSQLQFSIRYQGIDFDDLSVGAGSAGSGLFRELSLEYNIAQDLLGQLGGELTSHSTDTGEQVFVLSVHSLANVLPAIASTAQVQRVHH